MDCYRPPAPDPAFTLVTPSDRPKEDADVETASEAYAARFAGDVGRWFLERQARDTLQLLEHLDPGAKVLDVGGGHAQLAPALLGAGYRVTVAGSHRSAGARLSQWVERGQCHFEVADFHALPHRDRSFVAVLCFRLLTHSVQWTGLIRELCRVAQDLVVVEYPSIRSVNVVSDHFFALKRRIEGNTRPYTVFSPGEIRRAFEQQRFHVVAQHPQFLFPMVLHRWAGTSRLSRLIEAPGRYLGLTRWLGSPIIARADRRNV
ncbi:MAG TPA: methyltransferase domain-containing protein [Gemmatimonadales bacterium]|nr:methyltransferase domain-containing protein [Gemmatimonadales bacterium]